MDRHAAVVSSVLAQAKAWVALDSTSEGVKLEALDLPLDELYVLRFVVSAMRRKSGEKAGEQLALQNLLENLKFRGRHREELKSARDLTAHPPHTYPITAVTGWIGNDMVAISRLGTLDQNEVVAKYSAEEATMLSARYNERLRVALDQRTRETGILCKVISVVDMHGFALAHANMTMLRAFGTTSKFNETHLPQFLGSIVILNAPATFRILYSMAKNFMSQSTLEKIKMCGGKSMSTRSGEECPFLAKLGKAALEAFPPEFGGSGPENPDLAACREKTVVQ